MATTITLNSLAHFPRSPFFPATFLQTYNPATHRFPCLIIFLPLTFNSRFHRISSLPYILFSYFRDCTCYASKLGYFIQSILCPRDYLQFQQTNNLHCLNINHVFIILIPVPIIYSETHIRGLEL